MVTNAEAMMCGNCGHESFRMFCRKDDGYLQQLFAECCSCKSVSVIEVDKPHIQINWGDGAEGVLCEKR
jgi:hypothetical protein